MEEEGAWPYQGAWPRVTRRGGGAESRWASRSAAGPRPLAPPVSRHAGAHARGDVRNAIKSAASSSAGPECVGEAERSGFLRQQCLDGTGRARARRLTTSTTTSRTPTPPPPSHPILAQRHGYASLPGAPELPPGLRGGRQPPDQPGALRVLRVPQHGERGKGAAGGVRRPWWWCGLASLRRPASGGGGPSRHGLLLFLLLPEGCARSSCGEESLLPRGRLFPEGRGQGGCPSPSQPARSARGRG